MQNNILSLLLFKDLNTITYEHKQVVKDYKALVSSVFIGVFFVGFYFVLF